MSPERPVREPSAPPSQRVATDRAAGESRNDIDKQIAWHYAQIALLKAKRNAIAPISSLPNELMTRILTIFAVESSALFNLKWTKIIHVCRHWHALALAAHSLWSYIDLSCSADFNRPYEQLRRSGVAPLSLKLPLYDEWRAGIFLPHSERIHKLELRGDAKHVIEVMAKLPTHNFPILTYLSLDLSYKREDFPVDLVPTVPDALFDGRLSSLRKLKLGSVAFPSRSLGGLTTLSLSQCDDSSTCLPQTFGDLLEMLKSSPRLCSLKLDPIAPPTAHQDFPIVDLPELDRLCLYGDAPACAALLNHLHFPPRTKIQIFPYGVRSGMDVRNILVPLRKHVRNPGAEKPLLIHIDRGPSHCTIAICHGTAPHNSFDCRSASALSLNSHPSTKSALRQISTKFLKAIPESVTHFDACSAFDLREPSWKTMIPLPPALETLFLQVHKGATVFLERETGRLTFPHIRRLYIRGLRSAEEDIATTVLAVLGTYVKARFANGAPLEMLEIGDPYYRFPGQVGEERLDRMIPLMKGDILRSGVVYDPVALKQQQEK
ncbi:F-box domain-containing protein [Mycena sanguinolenta]|uniref:F-box domain-containing protein n=1 Tax=Mycena sanguinolenta TaxID=230812 RepID=A0A8H6XJP6_9AGAR|nr:F-box domain-containing protein [Mycena sanguinolenta]